MKQSHLRTISASRGPHLILGELLSITEQEALFEDLVKEHVDQPYGTTEAAERTYLPNQRQQAP
jgi:hypothetical protein